MSRRSIANQLLLQGRVAAKSVGVDEILKDAVQVNVPSGAEEKLHVALNEAVASAYKDAGITVQVNKPALEMAAKQINQALNDEIRELKSADQAAFAPLEVKTEVNGIECIIICDFACAATFMIGSIPAGAAAWVGGCVAVCALSAGMAALIAGAA